MGEGLSKEGLKEVQAEIKENISEVKEHITKAIEDIKESIIENNKLFVPRIECGRNRGRITVYIIALAFGTSIGIGLRGIQIGMSILAKIGM